MANTEIIDKLVSEKALEDLKGLNTELARSYDEWERLLPKIQLATTEFDRLEKSTNELYGAIGMLNRLESENAALSKRVSDLHHQREKIEREVLNTEVQRQKMTQEGIKTEVQKRDSIAASIAAQKEGTRQMEEQTKATQGATDMLRRFIDETKALSEVDSSKVVGEYGKGALSYGNALQALTQQLDRTIGLQRGLTDEFKNGHVTEQQYNDAMTQLLLKQSEFKQSVELLTEAYNKNRDAKSGVYAFSGDAFAGLSDSAKLQAKSLVEMSAELNSVRTALKELDKQYRDGDVTIETYAEKKAQLKNAESDLSKAIKMQSRELQLNKEIANAAEGSYDSLSAKYSLMKMEINALGEAEAKDVERKRELEAAAKVLYERMNELQRATGKSQLQVGDYEIAAKSLKGELGRLNENLAVMILNGQKGSEAYNQMAKKAADLKKAISEADKEVNRISKSTKENENIFKRFTGVVNQYWAAILAGYKSFEKALSGYKDIMMSNIGTGREFQSAMDGLSNSLGYLKTSIATMDFSNLVNGLTNAYTVGKEVSLVLAELFERRNSFTLISKEEFAEIEELKIQMRDANTPLEERIKLGYEIEERTRAIGEMEKDIINQEIDGYKKLVKSQTDMTDAEVEYYIVYYENNRKQIKNAQELIDAEKELQKEQAARMTSNRSYAPMSSSTGKESEKEKSLKIQVELLRQSVNFSQEAYDTQKKYVDASKGFVDNYVKAEGKIRDNEKATSAALKMTIRARSGYEQQLTQKQEQELKKRMEEQNKYLKRTGALEQLEYKKSADYNEMLYKDTKLSYEKRGDALRAWIDDEIAIIETKSEWEQKQEGLTAEQKELIREKGLYEIYRLEMKYGEETKKLQEDRVKDELKRTNEAIAVRGEQINRAMNDELLLADKVYGEQIKLNINSEEEREKITRDYQKHRLEIIRMYNQRAFDEEVKMLEKSVESTDLGENEKRKIREHILKLQKENAKEVTDYEIQMTEYKIEEMETVEERFNKFMNDKRTQAVKGVWDQALELANSYYDNELSRIDELEKREREYWDGKLKAIDENVEAGLMSEETADAKRRIIEEDQAKREKELEQQRKDMQKRQAVWQKSNAMIQAAINTALAVTSAIATPPAPLGIALAAIVGAMGAAQIAMIASQSVPSYKEGTEGHPGGWARVGDGGRSEMVVLPSGGIWKTPATDTYTYLPKGTEVLPDFQAAFADMFSRPHVPYYDDNRGGFVFQHDDVLRKNTKEMNARLSAIDRSIRAIRANSVYNDRRAMMAYRFNKISRHGS
jgi:hypothetical protein